MSGLVKRILQAHGGESAWRSVDRIFANCSLGGVDFVARLQPAPLRDVDVAVSPKTPEVVIAPFGGLHDTGHFTGQRVWIEDESGNLVGERTAPGAVSRNPRHWLWWDRLDVLYQAGAVIWFALTMPGLLLQRSVQCEELTPVRQAERQMERLRVILPTSQAVHGSEHLVYADSMGIIRQVDSRSLVYGGFLPVTQIWEDHLSFDGLLVATKRSYYPALLSGAPWQVARLVWLNIDDVGLSRSSSGR